jgi:mevalonate kinase
LETLSQDLSRRFSSKLLLYGEYTVILGGKALAIPLPEYYGYWTNEGKAKSDQIEGLKKLQAYILADPRMSLEYDVDKFAQDLEGGIYFHSNIPTGYGLGSSGSLTAAFYDRYATNKTDDIALLKMSLAHIESAFHGSSSGIDPLVSYLDRAIVIGETITYFDQEIKDRDRYFLIDTGINRSTAPLVKQFKERLQLDSTFKLAIQDLIKYNDQLIDHLTTTGATDLDLLFKISKIQSTYLDFLIPSAHINHWQDHHHILKLCGAGGGGMILGYMLD